MIDPRKLWTQALQEVQEENNKEENKMETNRVDGIKYQVRLGVMDLAKETGYGYVECTHCGAVYKVEPEYVRDVFEHRGGRHLCPSCGKDLAFAGKLNREFYAYGDINQLPYVPPLAECCCQPDIFNTKPPKDEDANNAKYEAAPYVGPDYDEHCGCCREPDFFKKDTDGKDEPGEVTVVFIKYGTNDNIDGKDDTIYPVYLRVPSRDGVTEESYVASNKDVFDIGQKFASAVLESHNIVEICFLGFEISEIFNSPGLYTLLEWCKEETGYVTLE